MITRKAGYIFDEIFKMYQENANHLGFEDAIKAFHEFCYFEIHGINNIELCESFEQLDKEIAVAFNIINRGTPTRASLFLCENLLVNFGFSKKIYPNLGEIVYSNESISILKAKSNETAIYNNFETEPFYNCIYLPILIAQIQHLFLLLILNKKIEISDELNIHCNELKQNTFLIAFNDLFLILENLYHLTEKPFTCPKINFTEREKAHLSIGIDKFKDNVNDFNFFISKSNNFNNAQVKIVTTTKINYKEIGVINTEGNLIIAPNKQLALNFFLNNIFRKNEYREGQLPIINRALQGKDVIGILPTGSGKSLTYQICTLLQPGIAIIIDPIRSLMIDQYDKLRQNFIDKALYINSFDNKEEKQIKQQFLADGNVQFAIISPERFQMLEFRDYLQSLKINNLNFSYAVIDEAHCISEWGHDFRYSYLRLSQNILKHCFDNNKATFTQFALTATASFDVIADIQRELNMEENVLITIPPEAIDRKELQFIIEEIPSPDFEKEEFFYREKEVGRLKYPKIKQIIKGTPQKLPISDNEKKTFFEQINSKYLNCGLLFCPTKSDKLGNGVVANLNGYKTMKGEKIEGLNNQSYLNCTTFMGNDEDGSIVSVIAEGSFENQKLFINNDKNLMIATKAFGMGIDKPNIRYTIHYSIPQSVESFYQEAGRAARDRQKSINYILYNDYDVKTNNEFIRNSHKSFTREKNIYNELLTEVNYESKFFFRIIENHLNNKFDKNGDERLNVYLSAQNPYLNIKNKKASKNYGFIRLNSNEIELNWISNVEQLEAESILIETLDLIKKLFWGFGNIEECLRKNKQDGLEEIIAKSGEKQRVLNIGFDNNVVEELASQMPAYPDGIIEKLKKDSIKFQNLTNVAFLKILMKKLVLDAYDFTNSEEDSIAEKKFVDNLNYEYKKLVGFENGIDLNLDETTLLIFKKEYWRIRSTQDTLRAVYRLSIIGVIDDYILDYKDKRVLVKFSAKPEKGYKENLYKYLRRYLGESSTIKWLLAADERYEISDLRKYLFTLTDFFENTISKKRLASAKFMDDLCKEYILKSDKIDGEKHFRESIVFYFTSKYAKQEFFPKDFINNTDNENIGLFFKYIKYIENPPETEQGLELNNAKHILGACERYKQSNTDENGIIDLLSSFTNIILDAKVYGHLDTFIERKNIIEQEIICNNAFERISKATKNESLKYFKAINKYRNLLIQLNPSTGQLANQIYEIAKMNILKNKLIQINIKFLEGYE